MKKSFNDIWDEVQPLAIKITIVVYLVLKSITGIFDVPLVSSAMNTLEPLFIGGLVLLIFLFIEKKLNYRNELETISKFHSDLPNFLPKSKYKQINIFALNGHYYFELIKNNKLEIDELNLLVRIPDKKSILYPSNKENNLIFHNMMKYEIQNFESLKNDGFIKQINIAYYNFDSILYFMLVDKKWMHFGLLKPVNEMPGSKVLESHFVTNKYETGRKMIENFYEEFKSIKKDYTKIHT